MEKVSIECRCIDCKHVIIVEDGLYCKLWRVEPDEPMFVYEDGFCSYAESEITGCECCVSNCEYNINSKCLYCGDIYELDNINCISFIDKN